LRHFVLQPLFLNGSKEADQANPRLGAAPFLVDEGVPGVQKGRCLAKCPIRDCHS
jgi:hypothetical protein